MFRKQQSVSHDDQATNQRAPNEMRVLTSEELVEIVGGPEIQNGGGMIAITSNASSSTGG